MPKGRGSRKAKSSTRAITGSEENENAQPEKYAFVQDLLKDFDDEVHTRLNKMKKLETSILQALKTQFQAERSKLSEQTKNMKMSDYLKSGGRLDLNVVTDVEEMLNNLVQETVGTNRPTEPAPVPLMPMEVPQTVIKKGRKRAAAAAPDTVVMTTRQTRRTVAQTPFLNAAESKIKTPAVWRAEAVFGEGRLETKQFVEGERPYLMVPKTGRDKGNMIVMTDDTQMDEIVAGIDSPEFRKIRAMKDRLSMMLKMAAPKK